MSPFALAGMSLAALLLAGCGGSNREVPRGIGESRDDLKLSPCACYPLQQESTPPWLRRRLAEEIGRPG